MLSATIEITSRDGSSRERFPSQIFKFFSLISLRKKKKKHTIYIKDICPVKPNFTSMYCERSRTSD